MIVVLRINAFLALIVSAIAVSLLSPGVAAEKITRVALAFGSTAGGIGIVIAMASIIGVCLIESGAADRIVRSLVNRLGIKRVPAALMGSGFLLSMPVFFDTVFYLLVPLARSLYRQVAVGLSSFRVGHMHGWDCHSYHDTADTRPTDNGSQL